MTLLATIAGILAVIGYGVATYLLVRGLLGGNEFKRGLLFSLGFLSVGGHGIHVFSTLFTDAGLQLGIISIASLFSWVIATISTVICLFRRIEPLLAPTYPLALITLIFSLLFADAVAPRPLLSGGIALHVVISIIAYSLMTLAFSQAILLWIQNYQLKHRHIHDILQLLPPLQTMESMLFDLVRLGFIGLCFSILTGFLYVDDLFAQHLVHKTVITLLASAIFLVLLIGRYFWGWRGMVAARWTLTGFFLLLLGYFGSRIILELIIQR